jgi:hypothetical protein
MDSLLSPPIRSNEGDQPTKVAQTFFALDADTVQPVCFLTTTHRDEVDALTRDYPKRWHVEEFFNTPQALGWKRAGTLNLNIRYGQMTMALLAQAAIHPLRQRLGEPVSDWDAAHLTDGDIRVTEDTLVVTYYNAPNVQRLREHYQDLPLKLVLVTVLIAVAGVVTFKAVPRARAHTLRLTTVTRLRLIRARSAVTLLAACAGGFRLRWFSRSQSSMRPLCSAAPDSNRTDDAHCWS